MFNKALIKFEESIFEYVNSMNDITYLSIVFIFFFFYGFYKNKIFCLRVLN